jgi:ubiquinone/menaquinone biosynthesis C-methylase UbiE
MVPLMDPDIIGHYSLGVEEDRLTEGETSRIEFARTKELLERFLPPAPSKVLDVGGGPGRYASWLAERGYGVDLVDPVPLHLEQAAARARTGAPFTVTEGDARSLAAGDDSCDAVMLLGPLYHLPERADRLRALGEARRVVAAGGPVIVAAISRFASLLDGLRTGTLSDDSVRTYIHRVLETGGHLNPGQKPEYFTTAYFHRADELEPEIAEAGLRFEIVLGIEGPGWLTWEKWDDPEGRENILRVARAVEIEPSVMGASCHLLAVGRK